MASKAVQILVRGAIDDAKERLGRAWGVLNQATRKAFVADELVKAIGSGSVEPADAIEACRYLGSIEVVA